MVSSSFIARVGRWLGAVLIAAGCSVGTADDKGFGALTLSPEDGEDELDDDGGSGDASSTGSDDDPTMGGLPEPETDSGGPVLPGGSSSGDESTGEPPVDPTTDDGAVNDDASSDGEPPDPPPPEGEPLWGPCDSNADCEEGLCFVVQDQNMQPISGYCSADCGDADFDCADPASGSADPTCLGADSGESLCALDCSDGSSCPFGMQCVLITSDSAYCF